MGFGREEAEQAQWVQDIEELRREEEKREQTFELLFMRCDDATTVAELRDVVRNLIEMAYTRNF